jgi:Flp pilus assembly protein TadD
MKNKLLIAALALGLAAFTFLLYVPTVHFKWLTVGDDVAVTDNAYVYSGLSTANAKWAVTRIRDGNWLPLTWISHMADSELWGQEPGPAHLVNAALHAVNVALLLLLLYTMTGSIWPSALAAALFAWHPLNVETVAWVAQRKFLLATFFGLLTLWAYTLYASRHPDRNGAAGHPAWNVIRLMLVILLFGLSVLCSPAFVTLPAVLLLIDVWPLQRLRKPAATDEAFPSQPLKILLLEKIPLVAISLLSVAITLFAHARDPMLGILQAPLTLRVENALVAAVAYLGQAIYPSSVPVFHPLPASIPLWQPLAAAALLAGLTALALQQRTRRPWLTVGWFWYLITLLPLLGLVQIGLHGMASRYTYIPLIGIFIAIAWTLAAFAAQTKWRTRLTATLAACALAGCIALSYLQLRQWKDSRTLFSKILEKQGPVNFALNGMAVALLEDGDSDEAFRYIEQAVKNSPDDPVLETTLALALLSKGDSNAALRNLDQAQATAPRFARAHYIQGLVLLQAGEPKKAFDAFNSALKIRGTYPDALAGIGTAYYHQGLFKDALKTMQRALAEKPHSKDFKNNLAWVLATCPEPSLRNGNRAVMLAREATSSSTRKNASYLDTLAAAYAEDGQFDKAVDSVRDALDISMNNGNYRFIPILQARLKLYEDRVTYQQELAPKKP